MQLFFVTSALVLCLLVETPLAKQPSMISDGVEITTELGPMLRSIPNPFQDGTEGDTVPSKESARLPTTLKPSHYVVKLRPFINGNHDILGSVDITFSAVEATDQVVINFVDIISKNETVSIVSLNDSTAPSVIQQTYDPNLQLYTALLSDNLLKGNTYRFHMDFQGYLNDKLVGFYRSVYTDAQGIERWLAASQFSPTDARRAFPCFDEPGFKATFDIHLARQTNLTALSNMPLVATEPIDGEPGWVWDTFDTTLRMSTYLVGFLISDFRSITSTALNHTIFKVWARKEALDQALFARDTGPPMLTFLEDYFGIDFPLPKLDMSALPDFKFSGMENWGLIHYRETALLYDPERSSTSSKQNLAYVVAHEIAHMWFGNLVTPHWWSELWLKEGFASYMGYVALDAVERTWGVMNQFVMDYVHRVMVLDSLQSSHPINVNVDHPDEISEIFDLISYRKGAAIIRMMHHFLTEPTYRRGLTNYLNALKFDNAEQDDLWKFLTEAGHSDGTLPPYLTVKLIMDTWTLKEGYPVVSVKRHGTSATLTQAWFQLGGSSTNTTNNVGWWIPISYTTQDKPNFNETHPKKWMAADRSSVQISDLPESSQWVLVNVQEAGYFRVNYDAPTWAQLHNQLKTDHSVIHTMSRAQLLDDAFNLARGGLLDYPTALTTTEYLGKEEEFVPWSSALNNFAYLRSMLERSSGYGPLRTYLLSLVVQLYNSVGFEDNLSDPHLTQYNRVIAVPLACKLGHLPCIENSVHLFKKWISASANSSLVFPNIQKAVLCTGIANGGEEDWNAAWKRYTNSNVGSEKNDILSALGCTKEVWILSRYLEMAFTPDSGIRKQDASTVFGAVASNSVGRDLAWNYLQDQWPKIFEYLGSGSSHLSKVVKAVTYSFNTQLDVKELEKFKRDYDGKLGSAVRALDQSVEAARLNTAWMDAHYESILQWLEVKGYKSEIYRPKRPRSSA